MAFSDDEKKDIVITKFKAKLDSLRDMTWDELKAFLGGLTKTKIKNFLKNAIQAEGDKLRTQSTDCNTMADDEDALSTEIDTL